MNELISELNSMKTNDFWNEFIETLNSKETTLSTTSQTIGTTQMSASVHDFRPKFNSSAFFDRETHPSIKDQVVLCRQIAKQLVCDESNAKSKGREMFEKRVQKSSKWVTTTDDENDDLTSEQSFHETTISEGPPNLRLVLDPRHVQDLNSLDFESNETEIQRNSERSQSASREIVTDLTSPDIHPNRGNALFLKRQQKSVEWIVDSVVESVVPQVVDDWTPWTTPAVTSLKSLNISSGSLMKYRDFNARARPFTRAW